nr:hypothetical protein B0A51_03471 [Rachicladosporium sp. CCFEE 5018]
MPPPLDYVKDFGSRAGKFLGIIPKDDDGLLQPDARRAGASAIIEISEDGKRRRSGDSGERSDRVKRIRTDSQVPDHVARLVQAERTPAPKDARPVAIPTNAPTDERQRGSMLSNGQQTQGFMAPKTTIRPGKIKSGWTWRDTLNAEPHVPAPPARIPKLAPLASTTSQHQSTPHAKRRSVRVGDSSDEIEDPKQEQRDRSTQRSAPTKARGRTVVDLVDDEGVKVRTSKSNGSDQRHRTSHKDAQIEALSQSQRKGSDTTTRSAPKREFFLQHESKKVNSFTMVLPGSMQKYTAAQARSNGSGEPRSSTRGELLASQRKLSGTEHAPVVLDESQSRDDHRMSQPSARQNQQAKRPKIDLADGFDEITSENLAARKSRGQAGLNSQRQKHDAQTGHPVQSGVQLATNGTVRTRASERKAGGAPALDAQPRAASPLLRKTFERDGDTDTTPAPRARPRARDRMQDDDEHKRQPKPTSPDDSPDVICGKSNLDTRSRHFTKSRTDDALNARPKVRRPASTTDDLASPDDNSKALADPVQRRDATAVNSIRVEGIYCRSCNSHADDVQLVWYAGGKRFYIECDGNYQCRPNSPELAGFGAGEVTWWVTAEASTKVRVRGPSTEDSMGNFFIHFHDIEGRDLCYRLLRSTDEHTVRTIHEAAEPFNAKWDKGIPNVQKDAKREAERLLRSAHAAQSSTRRVGVNRREPTPERIKYQDGSSPEPDRSTRTAPREPHPRDVAASARRSTRTPRAIRAPSPLPPQRWTETYKGKPWDHAVLYPSDGLRKVTVDFQDIERLDEGEFLNDNLIGYALRRIEETMAEERKNEVHFFNSFFFSSLMNKNGKKGFNYDAVKKWTKNKNLFDLPYVVVPINENLHWYVAIICNLPTLLRQHAENTEEDASADVRDEHGEHGETSLAEPSNVIQDSQELITADQATTLSVEYLRLDGEPMNELPGIVQSAELGTVGHATDEAADKAAVNAGRPARAIKKSKQRTAPPLRQYATDAPNIITFDSLSNTHVAEVAKLKDYLNEEGKARCEMDVPRGMMQGLTAKGIPQQSNFCDCGLFLIGYVEAFAADPKGFIDKVLGRTLDPEKDFAGFDPSLKRSQLREGLFELYEEQHAVKEALKKQKKANKANASQQHASSQAVPKVAEPGSSLRPSRSDQEGLSATVLSSPSAVPAALNPTPFRPVAMPPISSAPVSSMPQDVAHDDASSGDDELPMETPHPLTESAGDQRTTQASSQLQTPYEDDEMLDDDATTFPADDLPESYASRHQVDLSLLGNLEDIAAGVEPLPHSPRQTAPSVPGQAA